MQTVNNVKVFTMCVVSIKTTGGGSGRDVIKIGYSAYDGLMHYTAGHSKDYFKTFPVFVKGCEVETLDEVLDTIKRKIGRNEEIESVDFSPNLRARSRHKEDKNADKGKLKGVVSAN
jgi:hypothetical protein